MHNHSKFHHLIKFNIFLSRRLKLQRKRKFHIYFCDDDDDGKKFAKS